MAEREPRHATHDLAAIVAFVDGESTAAETALATTLLRDCPSCTLLADDLRSMAAAERVMAVPARSRDFRLTPADAARAAVVGEPSATPTRLVRDMTDRHPTHDPALIAASVDDVLTIDERRTVDDWLATCSACVTLRTDLLAIAAANRALPTPARPRDFRLTEQDVARVGQAGWRHLLAWIGGSRDGITKPLAAGLMTFGLVGVLLTGGSSIQLGAGASSNAPAPSFEAATTTGQENQKDGQVGSQAVEPSAAGPSAAGAAGAANVGPTDPSAPLASDQNRTDAGTDQSAAPGSESSAVTQLMVTGPDPDAQRDASRPAPPIGLFLSIAAVVAGVLLLVARRVTRSQRSA